MGYAKQAIINVLAELAETMNRKEEKVSNKEKGQGREMAQWV